MGDAGGYPWILSGDTRDLEILALADFLKTYLTAFAAWVAQYHQPNK